MVNSSPNFRSKSVLSRIFLIIIRSRWVVYLLALSVLAISIFTTLRLPIDALPNLSENQVLVYSRWPDHLPQEIYDRITRPLSETLHEMDGVNTVRGSSDVGYSLIYVIFHDQLPISVARQRVLERLAVAQVELPPDVQPQVAPAGIATGQIFWYTLHGDDSDLLEVRAWQDRIIAPRLRKVSGVAEVASVGGFHPEVHVDFDPAALAAADLSLAQAWQQIHDLKRAPLNVSTLENPSTAELQRATEEFGKRLMHTGDGRDVDLNSLARITLQPAVRYGSFEQDASECVAGVVHMQPEGNTLAVTQALLGELRVIQRNLPSGWTCLPCYDRTPLIRSAIGTVTRTLLEALIVTSVCIVLIMRHWRASLVIALTLPLAVLAALLGMASLPVLGQVINANIMSLAGIAVSVGILVDAAVVIVENVNYRLHQRFGAEPVSGNTDSLVAEAASQVAWPAVMAIVIMLVSFAPLFALGGIDGQMMRPLLWTKTFTLLAIIVLALTLVPCLARDLLRGRMLGESESRFLRGIRQVYEPLLAYCFHSLGPLACMLSLLAILAAVATGVPLALRCAVVLAVAINWLAFKYFTCKVIAVGLVIGASLSATSFFHPLGVSLRIPLDEGMIMDMPITIPRTTVQQATDDLKARNMILCRFPEIAMVSGKVGRAETAFDPAPVDMIETMVEFRPTEVWPRRRLFPATAREQSLWLLDRLLKKHLIEPPTDQLAIVDEILESGLPRFDAVTREVCWQTMREFEERQGTNLTRQLATKFLEHARVSLDSSQAAGQQPQVTWLCSQVPLKSQWLLARQLNANTVDLVVRDLWQASRRSDAPISLPQAARALTDNELQRWTAELQRSHRRACQENVRELNQQLSHRAANTWNRIFVDELFHRVAITDDQLRMKIQQSQNARYGASAATHHSQAHVGMPGTSDLPMIEPHRVFDLLMQESDSRFKSRLWLWPHTRASLTESAGEMDRALQMPGWANVWTRPIQNRVDMLTTGVNAEVGIRVLGSDLAEVVMVSEEIARIVKDVPGAAGVIADPIRGKNYTEFVLSETLDGQSEAATAEHRLAAVAATLGITEQLSFSASDELSQRASLRVTLQQPHLAQAPVSPLPISSSSTDLVGTDLIAETLIPLRESSGSEREATLDGTPKVQLVRLGAIGKLRHLDGPATIKSTDGRLSNYVRLNVVGRSADSWVAEARERVAAHSWPPSVSLEWTGQFVHAAQTQRTMRWMIPVCCLLIVVVIWLTFRDVGDTLLILLTLPGAMVGALLAQLVLDVPFSLSVLVGYISCLGMAAATGMVMIVYLRAAIEQHGGLNKLDSLVQLEQAVISGAVHRLRPKILTEVAMIFSLVPLLWSTGAGADVIRPLAAPVLGGILIADEVVDLLLPALFYRLRRRRWIGSRRRLGLQPVQGEHLVIQ